MHIKWNIGYREKHTCTHKVSTTPKNTNHTPLDWLHFMAMNIIKFHQVSQDINGWFVSIWQDIGHTYKEENITLTGLKALSHFSYTHHFAFAQPYAVILMQKKIKCPLIEILDMERNRVVFEDVAFLLHTINALYCYKPPVMCFLSFL